MGAAIRLYFGRIYTDGLERIDTQRPTLILANHTSTFLDPMLLAIFLRRKVHFYTRGDVFKNKLAARIFRSLGMMPIYRRSEGAEHMHQNDTTNEEALRILRAGGAVLIFAEGLSEPWKVVKPLKKGPFRLAAMAVEEGLDVAIMPLGINYLAQTHPGTPAWLVAGEMLEARAYFPPGAPKAQAITQLLRDCDAAMRRVAFDARLLERGPAVDVLAALAFDRKESGAASFEKAARCCHRAATMPEEDWTVIEDQAARLVALNRLLRLSRLQAPWAANAGIQSHNPRFHTPLPSAVELRPAPPVLPGIALPLLALAIDALHALPLLPARRLAYRLAPSEDFFASVYISLGMVLMLGWYALMGVALGMIWGWPGLAALPLIGALGWICRRWARSKLAALQINLRWRRAKKQQLELATEYEALLQSIRNYSGGLTVAAA